MLPVLIRIILKRKLDKSLASYLDQVQYIKHILLSSVAIIASEMEKHVEVCSVLVFYVCGSEYDIMMHGTCRLLVH